MRKYINKIIVLFILLCFSTTLTGCWDYVEMTDLKYVAGMAIDRDKDTDEYILTMEVLEGTVNEKTINSSIVQTRGETIHKALRDAIKKVGKMLQLSHAKVVIISKDIAKKGIIPVIDLINRDVEIRNDMWVIISEMSTASEILNTDKKPDEILSYDLESSIKSNDKTGEYRGVQIFKLINDISSKGISPSVPMISIVKDGTKSSTQILGTAVFKGDKMIGKLNKVETMMLDILVNPEMKFVIPIVLGKDQNISLEVIKTTRKAETKVKEGRRSLTIYVDLETALSELAEEGVDYVAKDGREKVKKKAEEYIQNNCLNLIEKLQKEYDTDIIGTGYIFRKKEPKEWDKVSKDWDKAFVDTKIKVEVNVDIQYTGLTNKNIGVGK
ncbi:Ger(x)C family spore germination protein [Hathewaya massiliensis]|uniref:Ger(x)C family spore germination protein n=1 Tax=Hathewaya massiliensis TaxID=1964382 RepID=UPI0011578368|nr:Ger(x)C family spore germination protein [Hathewaya massiliensis]